ncbi:hypothetical protein ACUOCP_39465, partial [Escherichia sp. R-CC3]
MTIHRGTVQGGGLTKVGSDNLLMINAHIAHDCTVGNRCILANNATLAGHVSGDAFANAVTIADFHTGRFASIFQILV